jgi:hypothetical protein
MSESRSKSALLAAGLAWVFVYFGCRLILDRVALPDWARIVVALSPIVPFAFFLGYAIANVLEALAFAFPAGVVVLMVLGLLQLVFTFHPQRFNFRDAWPILLVLYFLGLAWNWRRYS